jgi:DNA replication protein DnaC
MQTIENLSRELKLSYLQGHSQELLSEANHLNMPYKEFLQSYLSRELEQRRNNGIKRRMRYAKFPIKKYIENFDKTKYKNEFRSTFNELESLDFIKKKENIILIGSPGSGKTHYAIGLGIKAIAEGYSVLFVSVPNLVIELREALSKHQLNVYKSKFEKYDIVVLDELGYVSFDKSGAEILFNLLSNRNVKGSIIITSNLTFDRWNEVFNDTVLTGAMVDRLAHKAYILDISRDVSHRFEETISWIKNKEELLNDCQ